MVQVTREYFEKAFKEDSRYLVPQRISIAIERSLATTDADLIAAEYQRINKRYQEYITKPVHIVFEYQGELTLDAYTLYYFWRNFFIPIIALRDLTFHSQFRDIPTQLNILDLGSGTGAVTLGLLALFEKIPSVSLKITAIDCCAEALQRQKKIITEAGYKLDLVDFHVADINDWSECAGVIIDGSPYHFIFTANCLTEIPFQSTFDLMPLLASVLDDNGAIVIAEAQRNYTKKLIKDLALQSKDFGMSVYYPCSSAGCPYVPPRVYGFLTQFCWVWRTHYYDNPYMNRELLRSEPKDFLLAIWLMLVKTDASIYDELSERDPRLRWGPISKDKLPELDVCLGDGYSKVKQDSTTSGYARGHIVGITNDGEPKGYEKI